MIAFRCPHCGLATQVDPRYAGQTGPCAGCNKLITVPTSSDGDAALNGRSRYSTRAVRTLLIAGASLLVAFLFGWGVLRVFQPVIQVTRQRMAQQQSERNVERILRAFQAYAAAYGHLPPAYSVDEQGKPLHSWRVLILPYLGPDEKALAQQLRLNEPFDSPHNQMFSNRIPQVFVSPADRTFAAGDTSYLVISGPGSAFDQDKPLAYSKIQDPAEHTMLLIERLGSQVNWMTPQDLPLANLAKEASANTITANSPDGPPSLLIGTANHQARRLSVTTPIETLQAMATIAGNEAIAPAYEQ